MENKKLTTLAENREDSTVVYEYTPRISKDTLYQSEAQLEQKLIKMLQEQGYEYLSFNSEKELISNLRKQIENLNNIKFSDDEW